MEKEHEFIIKKMERVAGSLRSKMSGRKEYSDLMGDYDMNMLFKPLVNVNPQGNFFVGIGAHEWMDWSQKIHHTMQVALWEDTNWGKDIDRLQEWRQLIVHYNELIEDQPDEGLSDNILVLDAMIYHFMMHDLLPTIKRTFGKKGLTNYEKRHKASSSGPGVGTGCLVPLIMLILLISLLVIL